MQCLQSFYSCAICIMFVLFYFVHVLFSITRFMERTSIGRILFSLVSHIWGQDACVKVSRTFVATTCSEVNCTISHGFYFSAGFLFSSLTAIGLAVSVGGASSTRGSLGGNYGSVKLLSIGRSLVFIPATFI